MINLRFLRGLAFCSLSAGLLISCAPQQYVWGSYETELYDYYKNPESLENLMKALETAIAEGENSARKTGSAGGAKTNYVAPGLYAEYGYLLMTKNQDAKAKSYFEKEKLLWPESAVLMDKMIKVIDQDQSS